MITFRASAGRLLVAGLIIASLIPSAHAEQTTRTAMWNFFQAHYQSRTSFFRSENTGVMNVVLLGDSITEGFDVRKWFPFRRVLNRGIGSDIIGNGKDADDKRGVLQRLDVSVYDCATSHVFLLIGINDMGDSRPVSVMRDGYREILKDIRKHAPDVTVHVQSVLPVGGKRSHWNPRILELNTALQALASEFKYPYLDLHSLMKDENGDLKKEITGDGLHLNEKGYAIWMAAIDKEMGW